MADEKHLQIASVWMLSSADIWFDPWGAPKTRIASHRVVSTRPEPWRSRSRSGAKGRPRSKDFQGSSPPDVGNLLNDQYIYLRLTDESWLKKHSAMVIWYCIISCRCYIRYHVYGIYVSVSMVTPPIQLSFRISLQPAEELAKRLAEGIPDQLGTGTFHFF